LHIKNCHRDNNNSNIQIFNVGSEDRIEVLAIAHIIAEEMKLGNLEIYTRSMANGGRGWPGDVKYMLLDTSKIKESGWKAEQQSQKAVRKTVRKLLASQSVKHIDTQKPRGATK
jgi:UDP-glucose 4-epimerase